MSANDKNIRLNSRVLYFFVEGRRIIAVHGIRSKAAKIAARDRSVALDRKRDWMARNRSWNDKQIFYCYNTQLDPFISRD